MYYFSYICDCGGFGLRLPFTSLWWRWRFAHLFSLLLFQSDDFFFCLSSAIITVLLEATAIMKCAQKSNEFGISAIWFICCHHHSIRSEVRTIYLVKSSANWLYLEFVLTAVIIYDTHKNRWHFKCVFVTPWTMQNLLHYTFHHISNWKWFPWFLCWYRNILIV